MLAFTELLLKSLPSEVIGARAFRLLLTSDNCQLLTASAPPGSFAKNVHWTFSSRSALFFLFRGYEYNHPFTLQNRHRLNFTIFLKVGCKP